MRFEVKDVLTEEEIQKGLKAVIGDGLAFQAMITLTGGIFLVDFALKLGASNFVIGLLASIPFLAQFTQLPAIYLVEAIRIRREICVFAATLNRLCVLGIVIIPWLPKNIRLSFLLIMLSFHAICGAVSSASWNSWMRDLVPEEQLGRFFSKRMSLSMFLSIGLNLGAAVFIDFWKKFFPQKELYGYAILFFLGFLAGIVSVYFITQIPEPRLRQIETHKNLFKLIRRPFKDENFKALIFSLCLWNFAINLAAPFFTVYMLKRLQLTMSFIITLTVLNQLINVIFLRIWGKLADQFSNKTVFSVNAPLFLTCILGWTFTTLPERYFLTKPLLVILHILMGIASAGISLAAGNLALKLAPKGEATAYLAANNLANAFAAGIASILGGKTADFLRKLEFGISLRWRSPGIEINTPLLDLKHWDFLFFISFFVGLCALRMLNEVKETGESRRKILVEEILTEIRRPLRSFSTISGLSRMSYFPLRKLLPKGCKGES